jgi:hypothetical protein
MERRRQVVGEDGEGAPGGEQAEGRARARAGEQKPLNRQRSQAQRRELGAGVAHELVPEQVGVEHVEVDAHPSRGADQLGGGRPAGPVRDGTLEHPARQHDREGRQQDQEQRGGGCDGSEQPAEQRRAGGEERSVEQEDGRAVAAVEVLSPVWGKLSRRQRGLILRDPQQLLGPVVALRESAEEERRTRDREREPRRGSKAGRLPARTHAATVAPRLACQEALAGFREESGQGV